jgi:hypothetical protein
MVWDGKTRSSHCTIRRSVLGCVIAITTQGFWIGVRERFWLQYGCSAKSALGIPRALLPPNVGLAKHKTRVSW